MTKVETAKPRYAVDELPEFLRDRLFEDEDVARRAAFGWGTTWHDETDEEWSAVHADGQRDMVGCEDGDVTRHIARHDPARALADVGAKHQIIDRHGRVRFGAGRCHCCWDNELDDERRPKFPCLTLQALALPYADHPDYRQEWAL